MSEENKANGETPKRVFKKSGFIAAPYGVAPQNFYKGEKDGELVDFNGNVLVEWKPEEYTGPFRHSQKYKGKDGDAKHAELIGKEITVVAPCFDLVMTELADLPESQKVALRNHLQQLVAHYCATKAVQCAVNDKSENSIEPRKGFYWVKPKRLMVVNLIGWEKRATPADKEAAAKEAKRLAQLEILHKVDAQIASGVIQLALRPTILTMMGYEGTAPEYSAPV